MPGPLDGSSVRYGDDAADCEGGEAVTDVRVFSVLSTCEHLTWPISPALCVNVGTTCSGDHSVGRGRCVVTSGMLAVHSPAATIVESVADHCRHLSDAAPASF